MERSPQKRRPRKITERPRRRQPQHPPHPNTITTTHQNNDQARSTLYALAAPTVLPKLPPSEGGSRTKEDAPRFLLLALPLLLLAASCKTNPTADFQPVQKTISARAGSTPEWPRSAAESEKLHARLKQ